jgi:hypothetical protein
LGFGIGANVTVLTVVDAALLRGLPYPEPERLLTVDGIAFERHSGYLDAPLPVRTARRVDGDLLDGLIEVADPGSDHDESPPWCLR